MDVIIIKTGYIDRLIEGCELDNDCHDIAVIYTDKVWNKNLKPLINDQEVYELCEKLFSEKKNIDSSGMVVFKDVDISECIDLVREIQYCCFPAMRETDMRETDMRETDMRETDEVVFEVDGKKIMVVTIDCESG